MAGAASGTGLAGPGAAPADPSVAAADDRTYVAWSDGRTGNAEVYVAGFDGAGWAELAGSAHGGGVSGTATGSSRQPSLALDPAGRPAVAWLETTPAGGSDVRAAQYDPAAGEWVAIGSSLSAGGISGTGKADRPVLVWTAAGPVVAWLDAAGGTPQVVARRFDGTAWQPLAAASAAGAAGATDLALATDGTNLAAAWVQEVNGNRRVYVKEYAGGAWVERFGSASRDGLSGPGAEGHVADAGVLRRNPVRGLADGRGRPPAGGRPPPHRHRLGGRRPGAGGRGIGRAWSPTLAAGPAGESWLVWAEDRFDTPTFGPEPLARRTAVYAKKWSGAEFVEVLPGDARGQGISPSGAVAGPPAVTVGPVGRPTVAWLDAAAGTPSLYVRANGRSARCTT